MIYDLMVIGGGINGVGIARDAAGRGLSVLLCEKDDLAQHTSSASTKLIHGGLRYLEYHEFGLVRKALQEREVLLRSAPHIMGPLRFIMPHDANQRPAWLIRTGLFLYDHLAQREMLPSSESVNLSSHAAGIPLKAGFKRGFAYSDGWVQDARLVVLNALDAQERGAHIRTRTKVVAAVRENEHWRITVINAAGATETVVARSLVNAAGPWIDQILGKVTRTASQHAIRLVKGSHIIVNKLFDHPYAYIFQNPDKRIIFAIPYENNFTLIGTTDVDYQGDPGKVAIDEDEIAYLCAMSNRYFAAQIGRDDVVATMSGVRPLLDDEASNAASVTRDYTLEFSQDGAPLLSVFGGKITTYRKLAEEAIDLIAPTMGNSQSGWTRLGVLPGGDMPNADFPSFLTACRQRYPWLADSLLTRYAKAYGTRMRRLIANATSLTELGEEIAPGLFAAEVEYLIKYEWAQSASDILWRRSKLALHLQKSHIAALEQWLKSYWAAQRVLPATLLEIASPTEF